MQYKPPARLAELEESATLRASEVANQLIAKGVNVYKLDVGEPDFITPRRIIDAAYEAMKNGMTHYAPSYGLMALRQEIAKRYGQKVENVMVTPGSKQAIFYALFSILNPGDKVIIIDPAWPSYKQVVRLAGGVPTEVNASNRFLPDADTIRKAVDNKTRAIILNSPNNPTGITYPGSIIKELVNFAMENSLYVISDEIYDRLVYGISYESTLKYMKLSDGLVLINGFSKAYAMTGWRLGYALADPEITKQMSKIQGHTATSPATFVQAAAVTALRDCEEDVRYMVNEFNERRKLVSDILNGQGLSFVEPNGAFYYFIDLKGLLPEEADPASYLLEKAHVSVTSGEGFGSNYKSYVRISYATNRETIRDGLTAMFKALKGA